MAGIELKTSDQWQNFFQQTNRVEILDPDGWDRKNFHYSFYQEMISREEFMQRLSRSTISCDLDFLLTA